MTEVAARYKSCTSFDLPILVGAGLYFVIFFSKSFSGIYFWKHLLTYLVIYSGNSHLLSLPLEMILTFLWITESSSTLSNSKEELDEWHGEEDIFWFFPLSSLIFSPPLPPPLHLWSLYCLGVWLNSLYWVYYCSAVRWLL